GGGRGDGKGGGAAFRVRGVSLDGKFTLDELEKRDALLKKFDNGFKTVDKNSDLVDGLDTFHRQALEILRSDKTKKAFELNLQKPATREAYGTTPRGRGSPAARRLIEAGVRYATVSLGGWDTHSQTFQAHKTRLMPTLDQTLSALIADL